LQDALSATASLWPAIRINFGWVHRAAHLLANHEASDGSGVRRRLGGLLGAMARQNATGHLPQSPLNHFLKVTRSYWPGLFACYDQTNLPRTNNDLEQFFGRHRYHERRATGRKAASPSLVLRGSVRLITAAATRQRPYTAHELATVHLDDWRELRQSLLRPARARTQRHRFRRNPTAYLKQLEQRLIQSALPP
jgi:hypothetical protein